MLPLFDPLRDMTFLSVLVRLLLVVICGGMIGIEREYKRRPAGFRTHILICLGAAMTTLTSQYLYLCMGYYTDMARLGAQVIAGIGFIGAGTIIVTRRQRVKGLTTAAGLWATAIIGLTLGAGYFEAAIFATLLILLAELGFSRLEYGVLENTPEINIYFEYTDKHALDATLELFKSRGVKVINMEITRTLTEHHRASAVFTLRMNRHYRGEQLLAEASALEHVTQVEEL